MSITNPCEHIPEMSEKNVIQIHHMNKKAVWMKFANIDTDQVAMDTNNVLYCPFCGIKFEFS